MDNIKEEIYKLISKNNGEINLKQDFSLSKDCGFDSIRFVALIVDIEDKFSIEFEEEFLIFDNLDKFSQIYSYVNQKIQEGKNNE